MTGSSLAQTRMHGGVDGLGTELDADGYQPSNPFVSMQAACLAVGRLLVATLGITPPGNLIQYDGLSDPQAATVETMRVRPG